MTTATASALETLHLPNGRKCASIHKEILHAIETGETSLFRFIRGYVSTAIETSHDDTDTPLDREYGIPDISVQSLISAWAECSHFCRECETDLTHHDGERNGANFWLTRNARIHGHGYWRESAYDESAEFAMQQLTRASESFGEVDLFIGADRKLHFSNERRLA